MSIIDRKLDNVMAVFAEQAELLAQSNEACKNTFWLLSVSVIIIVGCEFLGAQQRRQIELLSSELKEVKELKNKQGPSDHSGSSHPRIPSSLSVSYKNIARKI